MELTGRLLGNRYELLSLLAGGGMGQVWRARDTLLKRAVAVKVLRAEVSSDPAFLARFRAEAQHAAGLTHPNIAAVYDYGEVPAAGGEHRAYLVMELVDGEPLSDLLAREGRLGAPLTLSILRQIGAALAVAHAAGVVHRDIKPANVLVARDGMVKITDFGIASSAASVPLTRTGQVMGTAHYLSPEQAQGEKAGPASDVYAAGAVAYECLAGRRPFDGDNPVQIIVRHIREVPAPLPPDVPAPVRALVERSMAKDPAQRLADGAALRAAVEAVMVQVLPGANGQPTVTTTVPLPLPDRKRPATATAVLPAPGAQPAVLAAAVHGTTSALQDPSDPADAPAAGGARSHRSLVIAVAAVTLVLIAAVVFGVVQGTGGSSAPGSGTTARSTPGSSTDTASPPPGIHLAATQVTGRPVDTVKAQLIELGLRVRAVPVTTAGVPAGQVVDVDPVGELSPGETVTVSYAVAPPAPPTPTAAKPSPAKRTSPKPGGHGHGKGHGKGGG
jgi:eukaryotic-like serine/threonine-protein kinase